MKKHKAELGSISHGTMRDEDLIPCFLNHIQYLDPKRITKLRKDKEWTVITNWFKNHSDEDLRGLTKKLLKLKGEYARGAYDPNRFYYSFYTEELFGILNEYSPPYASFGSSEGDGSDYGFWLGRWEDIKESADAPIVSDSSELPPKHRGEWFQVSDHGNVTLYIRNSKGKDTEIWGIV